MTAPAACEAVHDALARASAVLTIDLDALADNWRSLAKRAAGAVCAAVVKADAYGLGIAHAAPALWAAGARIFFVAQLAEGVALRAVLPDATLYVLGGLLPGTDAAFRAYDLRPVLGSRPELDDWARICRAEGRELPAALHVDTGMNRLGLTCAEALALGPGGLGFTPSLLMSHLACADTPGHPLTALQLERFRTLRAAFAGVPASLANSAGLLTGPEFHFDVVRPGIALYGGASLQSAPVFKPVLRLEAPIILVRRCAAGESIGYGAAQHVERDSRIAILSVGYADGFLRGFGAADGSAGAEAVIAGRRCPLVGRVSMDLVAVDVTSLPEGAVARGDAAVLLGEGIGVDDLAAHGGTIGYEVLTDLSRRYRRVYRGGAD